MRILEVCRHCWSSSSIKRGSVCPESYTVVVVVVVVENHSLRAVKVRKRDHRSLFFLSNVIFYDVGWVLSLKQPNQPTNPYGEIDFQESLGTKEETYVRVFLLH
ncbi:hypothetical protein M0804_007967 [Polistes exclamans]|nr:hypothetical protein M0804_007967 [Polistes exclamans]